MVIVKINMDGALYKKERELMDEYLAITGPRRIEPGCTQNELGNVWNYIEGVTGVCRQPTTK